jgi:SAM-dependent methyltransferase
MNLKLRLVLLSFLMLFVELALIRWTGSNVVYLSYFSNFVLLGSFLGIGLGFLRSRAKHNLFPWAPVALAALVVFVLVFPVEIDRSGSEAIFFGSFAATGLPTWLTLPVIFLAVAAVMSMIAEGVARTFVEFEALEAYRLDVLGSIAGIIGFSLLSFWRAPPVVWGVVMGAVFLLLLDRAATLLQVTAIVATIVMLADESLTPNQSWSPYYKVSTRQVASSGEAVIDINVNGIPHQSVQSSERRLQTEPIYFKPYERLRSTPKDVLIVGAGNGGDVAIALERGARYVDAVEIDPRLYEIGTELNPDRPYADPRVDVHINDGRAFLENSDRRYDLILFALPDSLTLVSGQASLRLESYLFTEQAMLEARSHLEQGGVFGMYNYYREQWLLDRLGRTLDEAYGHPPCIDSAGTTGKLALLTTGLRPGDAACTSTWQPASADVPPPATDDYPFLYLRDRGVPGFYLLTAGLILLLSLIAVRTTSGPLGRMSGYLDLFFMGAAFLLIETKSVVQFALLFGTTWFVNALVFIGILVSVLAAIEVARHVRFKRPQLLYLALLVGLAVAWVVPPHSLLNMSIPIRFLAAVVLAFTPIFLANLVFAERFKNVGSSTVAFGANLLGAMVGGLLEYSSLVVGYRALLIVAAALYGVAFLLGRRHLVKLPDAASVPAGMDVLSRSTSG